MTRLFGRLMCALDRHSWLTPVPWHGAFAPAWRRCRRCGEERVRWEMPLDEYKTLIDKATRGN